MSRCASRIFARNARQRQVVVKSSTLRIAVALFLYAGHTVLLCDVLGHGSVAG